jgi:myosin heavy subunit
MKQIIKRLELIKTSIDIEDDEIIELQTMKLNSMDIDNSVKEILIKIQNHDLGSAMIDIEEYIKRYSGLVIYEDSEVSGLKMELKILENKLSDLSYTKDEYLNDINDFNLMYHQKLGDLIQNILDIKNKIFEKMINEKKENFEKEKDKYNNIKNEYEDLKKQKQKIEEELENLDEFDDEYDEKYEEYQDIKEELEEKEEELNTQRQKTKESKKEYENDPNTKEHEETKQEYEEFKQEHKQSQQKAKDTHNLNEEEKKELKKLWRKASKLCHPDIVADEYKAQATEIMQQLNDAYSKKDLSKVKEILNSLENGIAFDVASDTIDDKEVLKAKIEELRKDIAIIEQEIETIQEDETYQIINSTDDLDEYFDEVKEYLENQYKDLENELEQQDKKENDKKPDIDDDEYWDMPF